MENLGFNLILIAEVVGIVLLVIIMFRQGIQNKDILRTIDRNSLIFEKNMESQEKVAENLERTERFLIESQTQINSRLANLEKK